MLQAKASYPIILRIYANAKTSMQLPKSMYKYIPNEILPRLSAKFPA